MAPSQRAIEQFHHDIVVAASRTGAFNSIEHLIYKLTRLYINGKVKTNHSVLEIVVAGYLAKKGYEYIDVEHVIDNKTICDIYAVKQGQKLIVEVETGYIPPSKALDPLGYLTARIIAKLARYKVYADQISVAVPPSFLAPIPPPLLKPPEERSVTELLELKKHVEEYYGERIDLDSLAQLTLDTIMVVDVGKGFIHEVDPPTYYSQVSSLMKIIHGK